jgi:hypothetical protein
MMRVYGVTWPQDGDGGVAKKPQGWSMPKLRGGPLAHEWQVPTFVVDGKLVDLQPNNAGVRLLSKKMYAAMERTRAPEDKVEWLVVHVKAGDEMHEYAIPHFIEELDVIDRRQSVLNRVTGSVIKPHLRAEAVSGHRLFTYSSQSAFVLLFTEEVYEAVKQCSGCSFFKVGVSLPAAKA